MQRKTCVRPAAPGGVPVRTPTRQHARSTWALCELEQVTADLRAGRIVCYVDIDAPRAGRPATRVNWLVRQLKDAPDSTRVEAFVMHGRGDGAADLLRQVRTDPNILISDPSRELRSFRIALSTPAGSKRGTGRGAFIDSVLSAIDDF